MPFSNSKKKIVINYLGINLAKDVITPYRENYKLYGKILKKI